MPGPLEHGSYFTLMNESVESDGMGGTYQQIEDGATFKCLFTLNSTLEARIAEKSGVTSVYDGLVDKDFPLKFDRTIRWIEKDTFYRVTSNPEENESPGMASFSVKKFTAELQAIPGGTKIIRHYTIANGQPVRT